MRDRFRLVAAEVDCVPLPAAMSNQINTTVVRDFAMMTGVELVVIDEHTTIESAECDPRLNRVPALTRCSSPRSEGVVVARRQPMTGCRRCRYLDRA